MTWIHHMPEATERSDCACGCSDEDCCRDRRGSGVGRAVAAQFAAEGLQVASWADGLRR